MKRYSFIKLILELVIILLGIFIVALNIGRPDTNAYMSFISLCNIVLSIMGIIISIYKKEFNDTRMFAFSLFVWGIYFIIKTFV